jgi:glutamyl-tRNA(Gln) amidotransferase subunit D
MNDQFRGYRGEALETLKAYDAQVWSDVVVVTDKGRFTGIVLPRSETADQHHIVLKLRSGYNVGIAADSVREIIIQGRKEARYKIPEKEFLYDPEKPTRLPDRGSDPGFFSRRVVWVGSRTRRHLQP